MNWGQPEPFSGQTNPREECPAYLPRSTQRATYDIGSNTDVDVDVSAALVALEAFEEKWRQQLPVIWQAWRSAWEHVTPFMAFEPEVRRVIYTTNAIEALNRQLRKAIKTKAASHRGRSPQADLPRDRKRGPAMDQDPRLDKGNARD